MIATKTIPYYRQFEKDLGKTRATLSPSDKEHFLQRVALIILPFLALYQPLGRTLSVCGDTARNIFSINETLHSHNLSDLLMGVGKTALSTTTLATNVLFPPMNMWLTTGEDTCSNAFYLSKTLMHRDYTAARSHAIQLANSSLYLGLLLSGCSQLLIAFSLLQCCSNLYFTHHEYNQGHVLEASAHLALAAFFGYRCHGQLKQLLNLTSPSLSAIPREAEQVQTSPSLPKEGDTPKIYHSEASEHSSNALLQSINQAKERILLISFSFSDAKIMQALNNKAEEGVKVTLIIDKDHLGYVQRAKHPKIELLTRTTGFGYIHHKILAADNLVWLGSANFTPDALSDQKNIMTVMHHKELANYLYRERDYFAGERIRTETSHPLFNVGGKTVELLLFPCTTGQQGIEDQLKEKAKQRMLELINSAQTHLRAAVCLWTHPDFVSAFIAAKKRGVNVEVLINDDRASDITIAQLRATNIPVIIDHHSHNKWAEIDGSILINGSANWTQSGLKRNDESFVVLHGLGVAEREDLDRFWDTLKAEAV